MLTLLTAFIQFSRSFVRSRANLAIELVALRHQLGVLKRQTKRPRVRNGDRMLWIALQRLWPKWERVLVIVKPATVVLQRNVDLRKLSPAWIAIERR